MENGLCVNRLIRLEKKNSAKSDGKSVFSYLYLTRNHEPELLPENTSMQRAVKRHLLAIGQKLYCAFVLDEWDLEDRLGKEVTNFSITEKLE